MAKINRSIEAFKEARKVISGGVNSPVRSFKAVGGNPVFIQSGKGSKIRDLDNNVYTDFCMSWGALILGHCDRFVIRKVKKAISKGTSFGCPTETETELAKIICDAIRSIDRIRFVNSGTEAVMSAIRLARGFTSKNGILKFDGCYHGHSDSLLVNAGSGVSGIANSSSKGIPGEFVKNTISIPFNNTEILEKTIEEHHSNLACVITEVVPANMGLVLPKREFLETLRKLTEKYGIVLIFDEVVTGFRLQYGGAQDYFKIAPDLTCLGKIIGGGFPVGAFGGREEIMQNLAPTGDVYQAGTLSGNPVAMSAGIATLAKLKSGQIYNKLNALGAKIEKRLSPKLNLKRLCSMFTVFFTDKTVKNYDTAKTSDTSEFARWFNYMLDNGIYLSPSQFETNFISAAHTPADMEKFINSAERFISQ
jgi:glutamate-1-semialdehyde 2,1-aminomutase